MEQIIDPVDVELIKSELTDNKKLRDTNKGGNILYVVDAFDSPNVMREIGRLREISYRNEGASSGLSIDTDEFDYMEKPYKQLIVWNPDAEEIMGGYRYILGTDVTFQENGQPHLATAHMFHFSDEFISSYLPHTVELGRSFVTPEYQSSKAGAKAIFAMDNLWDGLGALMINHPHIMYFFGKMTIYPKYDSSARELIYRFLEKHFPDKDNLVTPYHPIGYKNDPRLFDAILTEPNFKEDYKILKANVMKLGTTIPPLVNSYLNTSATMVAFGNGINDELENTLESAILVCFNDMYDDKKARHVDSFHKYLSLKARIRFPNLHPDFEEKLKKRWELRRFRPREKFLEMLRSKKREN